MLKYKLFKQAEKAITMFKIKIIILVGIIFSLLSCGGGVAPDDNTSDTEETSDENITSTGFDSSRPQCCKTCQTGKACGSTCVSLNTQCNTRGGCACNAKLSNKLTAGIPVVGIGRIPSYAGFTYSSGSEQGIVNDEGIFTYEVDIEATFSSVSGEQIVIDQPGHFSITE